MAVNTPDGLTDRQQLSNVVLQGDTWGSLLASIQVDNICKDVVNSGYGYKYKDILPVSMLALVDDMVGITYAGYRAHQMNTAINVKTAEKRLQFGESKCKTMIIGKNCDYRKENPIMVDKWKIEHQDEDFTEIYDGLSLMETTEQQKYLSFLEVVYYMRQKHITISKKTK